MSADASHKQDIIEVQALGKTFQTGGEALHVLENVNFVVCNNDFVAVLGASGSGKSTFLNLVGCLDRPSRGRVLVEGIDTSKLDPYALAHIRNRKIGFVFQNYHLLPRLTALENVEVPLVYAGVRHQERRIRARKMLERVGLQERLDHTPMQLSGGQQQRVAIARALVTEPSVILADEPTGALDSQTTHELMAIFQQLHADGVTLILATHDKNVASYARRVIYFEDGKIKPEMSQTVVLGDMVQA